MNKITPRTEPHNAPGVEVPTVAPAPTYVPPAPRPKVLERQGARSEPFVKHLPEIRGGICEFCGVLDNKLPSEVQYQLCPHFRGLGQIRCTYCPDTADPNQVIGHSVIHVMEHPDNPDVIIAVCNSYECEKKHQARFRRSG